MNSPDTAQSAPPPEWISERSRALQRLGAPSADMPYAHQWAWIFDYALDEATEELRFARNVTDQVDRFEPWCPRTLELGLIDACQLLGLPCDPKFHEQPTTLRQLFTPPLSRASLYAYRHDPLDPQRPLESLTPELFLGWRRKVLKIGKLLEAADVPIQNRMADASYGLFVIGVRLLAFTWPEAATARIEALHQVFKFLRYTSGLFDLKSGKLIAPETAALHEFKAAIGTTL